MENNISSGSGELGIKAPKGYQIIEKFPVSSAFKEVFKAIRITPIGNIDVVLKRYQPLDDGLMKRNMKKFYFEDQKQILTKDAITYWAGPLLHPNLIPCDIVENDVGEILLVEPLLKATLDKKFPSKGTEFLKWVEGLLQGVKHMHEKGYIHSDIKPENMGICNDNPVLFDFGISTHLDEIIKYRNNPGSIKTRPPEMFGQRVKPTKSSDMWSLGASFYYMLTKGDYPFVTRKELEVLPPSGSDKRIKFEKKVLVKVRSAVTNSCDFYDSINQNLMNINVQRLFRDLIRGCINMEPGGRPTAASLISKLSVLFMD